MMKTAADLRSAIATHRHQMDLANLIRDPEKATATLRVSATALRDYCHSGGWDAAATARAAENAATIADWTGHLAHYPLSEIASDIGRAGSSSMRGMARPYVVLA